MNRFILYGILLLAYLALSKSLSPSEYGIKYINKKEDLAKLIPGQPVTAILADIHSTGFLIKTYYQKFKVVYGFQTYEEIIVRTSRHFSDELRPYIGMSVFRRYQPSGEISYNPLPPGSIFIGDSNFGSWVKKNNENSDWQFFRVYRQLPLYLGWGEFSPSYQVFQKIQSAEEQQVPFFGSNDEFGLTGTITKTTYSRFFERQNPPETDLKTFLKNYFNENFIKREAL